MRARLLAAWASFKVWLANLWQAAKALYFEVPLKVRLASTLLLLGILVATYRDMLINLIVANSKKILKNASAKDAKLSAVENSDKSQANALVKQANDIANTPVTPDEDWYKK